MNSFEIESLQRAQSESGSSSDELSELDCSKSDSGFICIEKSLSSPLASSTTLFQIEMNQVVRNAIEENSKHTNYYLLRHTALQLFC